MATKHEKLKKTNKLKKNFVNTPYCDHGDNDDIDDSCTMIR